MKNIFKKTMLVAVVAALAFAAFPFANVFALSANPEGEVSNEKLEQLWARQLQAYERLGKAFDDDDGRLSKLQERIDNERLAPVVLAKGEAIPRIRGVKRVGHLHRCGLA